MHARVCTIALWGMEVVPVAVEVDVGDGLPRTHIVGLPDSTVRESQDRLVAAFKHAGRELPPGRITVNLSPTDLRKVGNHYDLPIAVAIALASGSRPKIAVESLVFLGELALNGALRAVSGVLPAARWAGTTGKRAIVVPRANATEASVSGIPVWPVDDLESVFRILWHGDIPVAEPEGPVDAEPGHGHGDLADVRGQAPARRALEIAAAGGHNLLFLGPPGSGKTILAKRMPTILPALDNASAVETTCIHSVAGQLKLDRGLIRTPPFRAPHHTTSSAAMIGGGATPRPGEVSLAHNGVLFLDEFAEFRRDALEALRQPLEEARVLITRARYKVTFPARFVLLASMNPCPCGHAGDPVQICRCTLSQVERYRRRVSGPLLDRVDLQIEVPRVRVEDLAHGRAGESSAVVAKRVLRARDRQRERQVALNGHLGLKDTETFCRGENGAMRLLENAMDRFGLSARAYHRILRVARTIADLEGSEAMAHSHVAEAVHYRALEQGAAGER